MIWYPYCQMKNMKPQKEIIKADGVYLYTKEKKLIDSISSWWSTIHGYNNAELNEAIKKQVDKFSHVMLGSLTHEPVKLLSSKLSEILPNDLDYCFFSDSGSVAVEVAIKMALQYFTNRNEDKKKTVLSLTDSYHGDTFKAMEIGDDSDYHFVFKEKKDVIHIDTNIESLEQAFKEHHNELACFIVEPLLQGAGGMKMYGVEFLIRARELCDQHDVILIFDEVATGFGRTGNIFVSNLVCPDIVVLGKALTAGYIGHAVTVANAKIYNGFYSDDVEHALMHGPTFMGNPLACSVALKSIEIFFREKCIDKVKHIEEVTKKEMSNFADDRINAIRILGSCLCIELKDRKYSRGFAEYAYEKGVFNRPFSNIIYAMFPYIISDEDLHTVMNVFKDWFRKD